MAKSKNCGLVDENFALQPITCLTEQVNLLSPFHLIHIHTLINLMAGYDVIIDQDLKPWLLEVNASPSLSANTKEDYMMKTEMLHGMLDVVDMEVSKGKGIRIFELISWGEMAP